MNRVSLRTRLVALAVLLVAFAVTAVGAATYVALHSYLYTRLDQQVTDLADNPGRAICVPPNGGPQTADRTPYSVLVTPDAQVAKIACRGYPMSRQLALPADDARRLASVTTETGPFTVHTPGGEYRAITIPATLVDQNGDLTAESPAGTVILALSSADARDTLNRLLSLEILIGAIAVVSTAVLGTVGVRLGSAAGSGDPDGADGRGGAGAGRQRAGEPGAGR